MIVDSMFASPPIDRTTAASSSVNASAVSVTPAEIAWYRARAVSVSFIPNRVDKSRTA